MASEACHIEIELLGQQIGIQDQYAAACGGFNQYKFYSDNTVSITPIHCRDEVKKLLYKRLMLFYTGITRDSRKILSEQTAQIGDNTNLLDELVDITDEAVEQIEKGNIDFVGKQLNRTWQIKKTFAGGITNGIIDEMYRKGIEAGAYGGKILGAGGGGFLLLYVPEEKQHDVRKSLSEYREIVFSVDPQGSQIVFAD